MARSVSFNGQTQVGAGSITRVNAEGLAQVGLIEGVVAIIGEADGGAPGAESGLISIRSPNRIKDLFRSGPLVDAARLAFQPSNDPLVPGGAREVVIYKVNQSTQSIVHLPHETLNLVSTTASGVPTTTVIPVAATLTADEYIDRWVDITLAAVPGSPTYRRRITDNAGGAGTSSLTITPALPSAPAVGNTVVIRPSVIKLTSRDYGLHTAGIEADLDYDAGDGTYTATLTLEGVTQVSSALGGKNYLQVEYQGGQLAVAADTVNTTGTTRTNIVLTTGGLVAAAHANKTALINGERVKITTNAAGTLTLDGTGISAENLASLQNGVSVVQILTVTAAVAQFSNAFGPTPGFATRFTSTITGVTGDDLSINITEGMTLRQLVDTINANPNYLAEIPAGINPDTTPARDFDFGTSTQISIQKGIDVNDGAGFKQDVMDVVDWFNGFARDVTAERVADLGDDGASLSAGSLSNYPYQMFGGTRGISANSNWQAGFDKMLTRQVNHVVPLIDEDLTNEGYGSTATWASVSQQLLDHVVEARGRAGVERGGWIGFQGTKAETIAAANSINDADVQLVAQNPTVLDSTGTLVEQGPRMLAVLGAGMRAGVFEVGEPLTQKLIRTTSVTNDSSWDPMDATDSADMVLAGVMIAKTIPGEGIKWFRDLTTHVKDDNLAYTDGNVRDIVRYVAYNLRRNVERRFLGRKGTPITIGKVKDYAATVMEGFRTGNIIVDSQDPVSGRVEKAYNALKVTASGDTVTMSVCFYPAVGINFILNDLYLKLPTLSA